MHKKKTRAPAHAVAELTHLNSPTLTS